MNSESGEVASHPSRTQICDQDCSHGTDSRNRAAQGDVEVEADLVNADSASKELAFTTFVGALSGQVLPTAARSVSGNQLPQNQQNQPTI